MQLCLTLVHFKLIFTTLQALFYLYKTDYATAWIAVETFLSLESTKGYDCSTFEYTTRLTSVGVFETVFLFAFSNFEDAAKEISATVRASDQCSLQGAKQILMSFQVFLKEPKRKKKWNSTTLSSTSDVERSCWHYFPSVFLRRRCFEKINRATCQLRWRSTCMQRCYTLRHI